MASTLAIMVDTAIASALPTIDGHFVGVDNADFWVPLVLVLPSMFVALGAPIIGALTDRIGRKPVLGVSTVLYGLAGGGLVVIVGGVGLIIPNLNAWIAITILTPALVVGGAVLERWLLRDRYPGSVHRYRTIHPESYHPTRN